MDLKEIKELLPVLIEHGVLTFKFETLELTFSPEFKAKSIVIPEITPETNLPPDLRTDNITDFDKILNWSGSPDLHESEFPLTGDQPLNLEV